MKSQIIRDPNKLVCYFWSRMNSYSFALNTIFNPRTRRCAECHQLTTNFTLFERDGRYYCTDTCVLEQLKKPYQYTCHQCKCPIDVLFVRKREHYCHFCAQTISCRPDEILKCLGCKSEALSMFFYCDAKISEKGVGLCQDCMADMNGKGGIDKYLALYEKQAL